MLFYSLAALGPLLAAVIASYVTGGRSAIHDLFGGLVKWRVEARWYLAALLGYPGLLLAALALDLALGGAPYWPADDLRGIHMPFWFLLVLNPPFVLCEEVGWRGYALPRLQKGRSALGSTSAGSAVPWSVPSTACRSACTARRMT